MTYVRKARIFKSILEGKDNEQLTISAITSSCGGECWKSSAKEDKNRHIDLWWKSPKDNIYGIDAKNHTSKPTDDYSWVEARNVMGGKGSIYGDADFIAFNANTKLYLVPTKELIATYENDVKGKEEVTKKPEEYYIPYTRSKYKCIYDETRNNDDLIFKMPHKDFEKLEGTVVINLEENKEKENE